MYPGLPGRWVLWSPRLLQEYGCCLRVVGVLDPLLRLAWLSEAALSHYSVVAVGDGGARHC